MSRRSETGMSLVGVLVALLVLGVLAGSSVAAVSLGGGGSSTVLGGGTGSVGSGSATASGGLAGSAADVVARQNLDTALTAVEQVAISNGYAAVSPAAMQGAERGLEFTSGASTGAQIVSLAVSSSGEGAATMALRSASGRCFYVWSDRSAEWFGTGAVGSACQAEGLDTAPASGSSGSVTWQSGSFPPG